MGEAVDLDGLLDNSADPEEIAALKRRIADLEKRQRSYASGEALIRAAVDACFLDDPPDLTVPKARPKKGGKLPVEIPTLHISDTQIGKETESYSSVVADRRLLEAARKAVKICERRRDKARMDRIKLYLIGDLVEGENIFPGQAHQIDQGVFDQACKRAPESIARVILYLLDHFPAVEVWSVPGNHGRSAPKGVGSHPRTNWDRVTAETLRTMLGGPHVDPKLRDRIAWNLTDAWYAVDPELHMLMVHGDQIRGGFAGYPWYGVGRKALAWAESVPEWRQQGHRFLAHGHFHQPTAWVVGKIQVLGNGTTESHNEYARAEIGLAGDPCQRLAIFEPDPPRLIADHLLWLT